MASGGNALFGRFWPQSSAIHALDPRTKVLGALLWVVVCFAAATPAALALVAASFCAMVALARIPAGQMLRSIVPLLFIVVLTALLNLFFTQGGETLVDWGWLRITEAGIAQAAFVSVRIALLLLGGSLLTLTTTTLDITEAFEKLLAPFARIGVPAHEFALVLGIALRFVPQFADELRIIRTAQLARGAQLSTSTVRGLSGATSLLVPLFASAFRHADTLANAMDARCYHGAAGRTRLHPLAFARRDAIAACALAALFAIVIAISFMA